MGELWSVSRVLVDTNAIHTEALGKSKDNSVEIVLELVGPIGMGFGIDLVIRVDDITRAILGKDIVGLDLAVEHPSGIDQVWLEGGDVL